MLVFGATTTVTIPACAAAVFSISEPLLRNRSAAVVVDVSIGVTTACKGWPLDEDDDDEEGGDSALYSELPSRGDCASEL